MLVFDEGDFQLKAYSQTGELRWKFGARGAGPWEIEQPSDLQVSSGGDIYFADKVNLRVTVLRSNGQHVRMISSGLITRVLPTFSGKYLARLTRNVFFELRDSAGNVVAPVTVPPFLDSLTYQQAEPVSASISQGQSAIAFRWSGMLMILDSLGRVIASGYGPEPLSFPEVKSYKGKSKAEGNIVVTKVAPTAIWAAYDVTQVKDELWVLFLGKTKEAGRIVDIFDRRTAHYLGSVMLPAESIGISGLSNGKVAVLYEDPEPRIEILSWKKGN